MKAKYYKLILFFFILIFCSCKEDGDKGPQNIVTVEVDYESLIRNPAMGWGLYADNRIPNAQTFWDFMDTPAEKYATFLYVRVFWSDMEPEEGRYAWLYDENYKAFIKGAIDRGLKLHFRVFYNSEDFGKLVTPQYVKQAGAEGYMTEEGVWTPYPDDLIFQEKLRKFVQAFAREYDNPDVVDCIDAYNLGWWGEGHHLILKDPTNFHQTVDKITSIWGETFQRVILLINYHREITETELDFVCEKQDFCLRHDALGSQWYSTFERMMVKKNFPRRAIIGESCYWGASGDSWKNDVLYRHESWRDVYDQTYIDAIDQHCNTLDLREQSEVTRWLSLAPDLVNKFVRNGGYRFCPTYVSFPAKAHNKAIIEITHKWKNLGVGVLPNANKRWNNKYKPAIALIDKNSREIIRYWLDLHNDPGMWLKENNENECQQKISLDGMPLGEYDFAIAIVDRSKDDKPAIRLAIKDDKKEKGWSIIGSITIVE